MLATPQSSTSVLVSWEPPPLRDQNGVITSYRLNFTSDEEFASGGSLDVNTTPDTMMVVDGLEEFVKYDFVVAAVTSEGTGPFSGATNATTLQAGTYVFLKEVVGTAMPIDHNRSCLWSLDSRCSDISIGIADSLLYIDFFPP